MEYRTLGDSGTIVSTLCLGTMTFGAESDEQTAFAQLDRFIEAGGNFLDTADVYSRGTAEAMIGGWLHARPGIREHLVIATKGRFPMGDDPNDAGLSRVHLSKALDASLRRLGTDHVDLYQAHAWDPLTPIEETLRFFDDAVRAGKIRYAGVSNFTGWQLQKASLLAQFKNLVPIVTLQPQYNLLARDIEFELIPVCVNEGIGVLPWSPLAGGWLTGKYQRDTMPVGATRLGENPHRGVEAYERRNTQRTWQVLEALQALADHRGTSMAVLAIVWLMRRPAVTSVILGARTADQLSQTLPAGDFKLTDEEVAVLDEVSTPIVSDYPYGQPGVAQRARTIGH
jgi:aryl-alcohol dehydrogenase-like predicted oxidoreductase